MSPLHNEGWLQLIPIPSYILRWMYTILSGCRLSISCHILSLPAPYNRAQEIKRQTEIRLSLNALIPFALYSLF